MTINLKNSRTALQDFNFTKLFIEELGWSNPTSRKEAEIESAQGYTRRQVAQLSGVVVIEVVPTDKNERITDAKTCAAIHKEISAAHYENLLIFVDAQRSQSLWYWVKRRAMGV